LNREGYLRLLKLQEAGELKAASAEAELLAQELRRQHLAQQRDRADRVSAEWGPR
jgi:hypothetical protein